MKPLKLYIDSDVADFPLVNSIQSRMNFSGEIIENMTAVFDEVSKNPDPVQRGKEVLVLMRNKGSFIRKCPGTRFYRCCNYKILHIGTFCTMDCSYCILQGYFHPPVLQYFVNHDDLFSELDMVFKEKKISRIGTGEFTDSLIWEDLTDLSQNLIQMFAGQSYAVLELKTKTTNIGHLKCLTHNRKTIVAWSLNTDRIIGSEERRTSLLSERLSAAARCESWGYPIAFHFDPLIIYDGCEQDYQMVVKQMFSHVSPKNIVWISLGSFRYVTDLKPIIRKRFPESTIAYGEFIAGLDGKMRYFKPIRIHLYQKMVSWIREIAPEVMIYFCMEDDDVWEKSLGFVPSAHGGLPEMLDKSAINHCGLGSI